MLLGDNAAAAKNANLAFKLNFASLFLRNQLGQFAHLFGQQLNQIVYRD
jgi:hypothetical protein